MTMAAGKRRSFRTILAGEACILPASVSDPLSMRAAEDLGYEMAMLAGSVASLAVLGAPDIALLTLTELADQVRRICRAGALPLLVDGDHGYGNALNVRRMIEDLEAAGAAAVTVEDTVLPAQFAGGDARLITPQELGGKVRAALDARTDGGIIVVGRTSASLAVDRADLLERQRAAQEAGADAVFITGLKNLQELDALATGARVPLILGSAPPDVGATDLAQRKVRICLGGHQAYFDGVAATYRRLRQQRTGAAGGDIDAKCLVKRLSRAESYEDWAGRFLK